MFSITAATTTTTTYSAASFMLIVFLLTKYAALNGNLCHVSGSYAVCLQIIYFMPTFRKASFSCIGT